MLFFLTFKARNALVDAACTHQNAFWVVTLYQLNSFVILGFLKTFNRVEVNNPCTCLLFIQCKALTQCHWYHTLVHKITWVSQYYYVVCHAQRWRLSSPYANTQTSTFCWICCFTDLFSISIGFLYWVVPLCSVVSLFSFSK